jgi:hypothetical protein
VQETWVTGPNTVIEDADINNQIKQRMKKFMDDSRLFKTPGHRLKPTDISLWKQHCQPYLNSRTKETIRPFRCPMHTRCGYEAQVRLCIRKNYKRLEFHGVHDEHSHAKEIKSKKLIYKQITAIHDAVIVTPNQSASKLHRNLLQSASQEKHMPSTHLRSIQRRVPMIREMLMIRQMSVSGKVSWFIGQLVVWCALNTLSNALQRHNCPSDDYYLPMHETFVFGIIKPKLQLIHINISSPHFILNAFALLGNRIGHST